MQRTLSASPTAQQLQEIVDNIPNLAWMISADGQSFWYNQRWYDYTGLKPEEMKPDGWMDVHDQKLLPELMEKRKVARQTGEPFELVSAMRSVDDTYRPFLIRVTPMKDEQGNVLRWFGTATDISQQVAAEEALRQSELSRQAIFDAVIDCITVFDMQGNVILMNTSAAAQYGIEGGGDILEGMEHAVQTYDMFYPDGRLCPFEDWPISRIYHGEQLDDYQLIGKRSHPNLERYLSFTGSLVKDDDGKPKYAVVVTRDITDRKKAEEEEKQLADMALERNELLKLNKAKDEFISIASHQLRTPATAVKQYIGILESGMGGELSPQQQKFLQIANESNERQLRLINDLLKTAQIDAARFVLNRQKHDIGKLIQEVIKDFEPTLAHKQQHMVSRGLGSATILCFDDTEMKVALANLLENASKYSPSGASIEVTLKHTKSHVTITVRDHGMGIAKQDQDKIYEKFSRINNKPYNTVTGTGLGLYMVKQIVELHGGTISVESTLHKGSKFKISLPL